MSNDDSVTISIAEYKALLNIYHALHYSLPQERVQERVEAYRKQFDKDSGE